MFVCLKIGMWRVDGNTHPCINLLKFCMQIPTFSRKVLTSVPSHPGPGELWTLQTERNIFKSLNKTKDIQQIAKIIMVSLDPEQIDPS